MPRLLVWEEGRFRWVRLPGEHSARWVAWRPDGVEALLVGNGGAAFRWRAGVSEPVPAPTSENLRGAAWHPAGRWALVVGNAGTILRFEAGAWERVLFFSAVALRRVAWSPDGRYALIVGNDGLALRYEQGQIRAVGFAYHHLRSVAFHPSGEFALVAGNRALYRYEEGAPDLTPLYREAEGDLIAVAFRPDGAEAIVAGFRPGGVEGREGVLYRWTPGGLSEAAAPVAGQVWVGVAWTPDGRAAWVVGNPGPRPLPSLVARWEDGRLREVFRHPRFRFTGVFPDPAHRTIIFPGSNASFFWTA
ncbi:MAG: hypothetical protein C4316_07570 [Chloroflexota bacterium]